MGGGGGGGGGGWGYLIMSIRGGSSPNFKPFRIPVLTKTVILSYNFDRK